MIPNWEPRPSIFVLNETDVHVWRARLDRNPEEIGVFEEVLSSDERERAARFRVADVRARFTAGRAILRLLLAGYLHREAPGIRFSYLEHGKPYLSPESEGLGLRFNLSHSHGLALYAFSRNREIGIDLEQIRSDRDHERLARRFFSQLEANALLELPKGERIPAFFRCWTRKEAYLKARGEGLAVPLSSFAVSLDPDRAGLRHVEGDPAEPGRWSLLGIDPDPGFAAALAVEGPLPDVSYWDW